MKQQFTSVLKATALLAAAFFFTLVLHAQGLIVRGHVTDATNKTPIVAASVTSKNSSKNVITGTDGNFAIQSLKGDVLTISFVGYNSTTVTVGGDAFLEVSITPSSAALTDVVVTALGIKREAKRIGYSLQEVKGDELLKAREANPLNELVGKVAGLNVGINQELLASPTVLLRGSPLTFYVVDGIPINSDTWNISPDDIETYTVLKGPTAAALYGSRGINGAILITTKRGKKNAKGFTVELNSSTQINNGFIAIPKVQNEYGGGDYDAYAFGDYNSNGNSVDGVNDEDYDVWGPRLDGRLLPQYDGPYSATTLYPYTFSPNAGSPGGKSHIKPTPWVARGANNLDNFLQSGLLTSNNINFSAVTDKSNLRMSVTAGRQTGITPNTGLNTVDFNLLESYEVSDKFKIEGNINYNRQFTPNIPDAVYGPNSNIYNIDIWTGADWNVKDPNIINYWQPGKAGIQSNFVEYKRYHNPYFMSYEWLRSHYKNDIYAWASMTYKFNKNLNVMLRSNETAYDVLRSEKEPWSAHPYGDEHNRGNYREDRRDLYENNTELLLSFNKDNIGNSGFSINAIGGASSRNMKYGSSYVSTNQLIVPEVYSFANSKLPVRSFSYASNLLLLSAYYSFDITYKKFFTITTTGRLDKSSAFPVGKNAYFYPSVTVSSVLSDYLNLPKAISFLKVRGAYVNVKDGGTQAYIGSSFQALGASSPVGYGNGYYVPYDGPAFNLATPFYSTYTVYNNQTGASAPNYVIDPAVKPSSRSNFEFGADIKFLHNLLGVSATYFQYKDGPRIYNQPVSETSGLGYFTTNGFATKRTGTEISVTGTPVQSRSGFRWDITANWSNYKEVYNQFPTGQTSLGNGTGYPYHIGDRVDKLFAGFEAKTPDGKNIVDGSGFPIYLPKGQYIGHADPDWAWGLNNKFTYGNFSVSFQFDGMVGGTIRDRVKRKLYEGGRGIETATGLIGQARRYESDHWTDQGYAGAIVNGKPILSGDMVQVVGGASNINFDPVTGVISNYGALKYTPNTTATNYIQDFVSSFYNDAQHVAVSKTYAKLRQLIITYSVPSKLIQKTPFSRVDISLVGRNLLYFFHEGFKDIDVDQYPGRDQFGGRSLEYNLQTPTTRSYGVNVNIVF